MRRAWCMLVLLLAARAIAHPTLATMAIIDVTRDDAGGVVEVRVLHDVLAYALNDTSAAVLDYQMYELLEGPPGALEAALLDARERFEGGFWVLADGQRVACELVRGPTIESVDAWREENPTLRLPMAMEFVLRARLPRGAGDLAVRGPHVLDEVLVVVRRPGEEEAYLTAPVAQPCEAVDIRMVTGPPEPPPAPAPAKSSDTPTANAPRPGGMLGWVLIGVAVLGVAASVWWVRARP